MNMNMNRVIERKPVVALGMAPKASPLPYHPDLIDGFLDDHHVLLNLLGRMMEQARQGQSDRFLVLTEQFLILFARHLNEEAVKLYYYIRTHATDKGTAQLVRNFQLEMGRMSPPVTRLLDSILNTSAPHLDFEELLPQLEDIGGALAERMQREEEQLYPLYGDNMVMGQRKTTSH